MRHLYPAYRALALAVLPWVAGQTLAQTTLPPVTVTGAHDSGLSLQSPASTASRLDLPLKDVPASAEVIEQRAMQDRGARSVVEAAQGFTGLTGAVRAGAPGVYQMRGFIENAVSLQFDGIRVGATTVYTRPYDPFNFDRIEVLRGPSAAVHGDSAVGGAINYVHRRPVAGPLRWEALAQAGRYDQYRLGGAITGSISETAAINLSMAGNRGDTFVNDNSYDNYHVVGSVQFKLSPTASLLFEADRLNSRVDNAYWGTPLVNGGLDQRLRAVNYNIAPDNQYDDKVTWLRALAEYQIVPRLTAKTSLYYYGADRDWKNFAAPRFNAAAVPQTVTIREVEDLMYDAKTAGLRHEMLYSGKLGALPARLLAGYDYQRSDFDSPRFQAGPTTINVDPFNPGSRSFAAFTGPLNRSRASDTRSHALFIEGALDVTATLRASLAWRHENIDVTTRFKQPANATPVVTERRFSANSWRAALNYALGQANTIYVSHTTGSEPIDGSAFAFISPADLLATDLTSARQWEIGSKHVLAGGRFELTTALYDIVRKHIFTADPNSPGSARQQIGEQSSKGMELAFAWRPVAAWTLSANAAYVHARNDQFVSNGVNVSGRTPRMVPSKIANAAVSYRPNAQWELGTFAKYVSQVYLNDDNSVKLPGWTRFDAYVRHNFDKNMDLTFMAKNLTDKYYADWGIQFLGAQVANIAPPRTWEIIFRKKF